LFVAGSQEAKLWTIQVTFDHFSPLYAHLTK